MYLEPQAHELDSIPFRVMGHPEYSTTKHHTSLFLHFKDAKHTTAQTIVMHSADLSLDYLDPS